MIFIKNLSLTIVKHIETVRCLGKIKKWDHLTLSNPIN